MKIPRSLRRIGCGLLLVLWFTFLLTPCLFIVLATQREIVLTHSDVPGDDFRIWLIQEAGQRGVAISNSRRVSVQNSPDSANPGASPNTEAACTLIDVRFLLWQGKGEPNHYCSCYTRQTGNWSSIAEGDDACKLAGEQVK